MSGQGPGGLGGRPRGAYTDLEGGGNPPDDPRPDLTTTAARLEENERRTERNTRRVQMRLDDPNFGEQDEVLLEIYAPPPQGEEEPRRENGGGAGPEGGEENTHTVNPPPPPPPTITAEQLLGMITAAAGMEAPQADRMIGILEAVVGRMGGSVDKARASAPLIGDAPGRRMFEEDDVVADPRLGLTLVHGHHLPLTLCTPRALEEVAERTRKLEMSTWTDRDDKKKTVVDVNKWPDEKTLTPNEWKDAWPQFIRIMEGHVQPAVIRKFLAHYDSYLKKQRRSRPAP
ncbi:hypothetical protein K466DRAFT_606491, partial [Polyporus arcularius HHB13444]